METPFRNVNLPVQAQPLLILRHFQITRQSRLQAKRIETHVVADVNDQVTVNRNRGAFGFDRLQIVIQHHLITGNADGAFRHVVNHDARPRHIDAAIEGKLARRRLEHHIRRHVEAHHWWHRDTHPAAFRRHARAPVIDLAPVGVTAEVDLPLLRAHHPGQRRAHAVEVH
ncbi:hypothetical protein D3C72_1170880 [compost metagenome]